jgi:hypothetical protein
VTADTCERCGGKLSPHSSLHVDFECRCQEEVVVLLRKIKERREKDEWLKVEQRRNRKTFI